MRVLVDSNVLLSYLAHPQRETAPARVVGRLIDGFDQLLLPEHVLEEVHRKIRVKSYFAERVVESDVAQLIGIIQPLAIPAPAPSFPIPQWTRDPNDDVLVALALAAKLDYLISGDKDLLVLGDSIAPLKIRSPKAFLDEIDGEPGASLD